MVDAAALELPATRLVRAHPDGGTLEVICSAPPGAGPDTPAVLLLPPHPLLGGDADNNLIRALAAGALARGAVAWRFDYRGVGNSRAPGQPMPRYERFAGLGGGAGLAPLLADARLALSLALRLGPVRGLVGYSYGAAVACALLAEAPALALVALCAPAGEEPLALPPGARALFLFAGGDDCTPAPDPEAFAASRPGATARVLPGLDHFCIGHEERLVAPALEFLDLPPPAPERRP